MKPSPAQQSSSEERRTGVRVNLTLPPELDRLLQRVADAAGTGKASFVREWLLGMQPMLLDVAHSLEAAKAGNLDGLAMMSKTLRRAVNEGQQAELELSKVRAIARKKPR
jgi:hypothetical protein